MASQGALLQRLNTQFRSGKVTKEERALLKEMILHGGESCTEAGERIDSLESEKAVETQTETETETERSIYVMLFQEILSISNQSMVDIAISSDIPLSSDIEFIEQDFNTQFLEQQQINGRIGFSKQN